MVEQVEADLHIRLRFQCSPHYTTTAFHPITEHFERTAGFARDDALDQARQLEALLRPVAGNAGGASTYPLGHAS